jgi:hypothetical protein
MISESYYWKKDLLKLARKLTKRELSEGFWSESDFGEFEKEIMIGFYIIRKLCSSFKLSNATVSTKIKGRKIPNNGRIVHLMNNHKYTEFYDFDQAKTNKFDLAFLANQLIHSYVFAPYFSESEADIFPLAGIHFCSDENRNKWLYELSIETVIALFKKIGEDYPAAGMIEFDEKKKDYKFEWHNL